MRNSLLAQNQAIDFGESPIEHCDRIGVPRRELFPTPAESAVRGGVHTHSLDSPDLETLQSQGDRLKVHEELISACGDARSRESEIPLSR